jgi:5-methylcytosine-specific restriction endonuclease McrA
MKRTHTSRDLFRDDPRDNIYQRSADYRKVYFQTHPPDAHGRYLCPYCGLHYQKAECQIDHIIPVHEVSRRHGTNLYRHLLKRYHCTGVNDAKNLTTACALCNRSKGARTGLWVVRGFLGQKRWFWPFVRSILIVLCAGLLGHGVLVGTTDTFGRTVFSAERMTHDVAFRAGLVLSLGSIYYVVEHKMRAWAYRTRRSFG